MNIFNYFKKPKMIMEPIQSKKDTDEMLGRKEKNIVKQYKKLSQKSQFQIDLAEAQCVLEIALII